jgi:Protein of unknown function (DUF3421)
MRIITISAALSAGLMAGQAMALDQLNWIGRSGGAATSDTIVGGKNAVTVDVPIGICRARASIDDPNSKYPGGLVSGGCSINLGGAAQVISSYEVLVPGLKSASSGTVPTNATNKGAHGVSGAPLDFCRADLGGGKGVQLGSLAPGSRGCLIPYGGATQTVSSSYDVLVDLSPRLPLTTYPVSSGGNIPLDALVGGKDTDGQTLYYCQASYGGAVVPGKTGPKFKSCDIPWQGYEVYVPSYQVLVPLWKNVGTPLTFPAYTYPNGVTKIHVCRGTASSSLTLPGRYNPSSDLNNCNLSNGSAADYRYKSVQILSE